MQGWRTTELMASAWRTKASLKKSEGEAEQEQEQSSGIVAPSTTLGSTPFCTAFVENGKENGKFLLAARKFRRATSTHYIISMNTKDMSRGNTTYVGKLRSNFLGTEFPIYDSQPPHNGVLSSNRGTRCIGSKQLLSHVHSGSSGSYNVAHIAYELNVVGMRGPRRMQCTLYTILRLRWNWEGALQLQLSLPQARWYRVL